MARSDSDSAVVSGSYPSSMDMNLSTGSVVRGSTPASSPGDAQYLREARLKDFMERNNDDVMSRLWDRAKASSASQAGQSGSAQQ